MSNKNEMNNNTKNIDSNGVDRSSIKQQINDNSISKINNQNIKSISKSKNKEKRNRNILPPQEKPTFEKWWIYKYNR